MARVVKLDEHRRRKIRRRRWLKEIDRRLKHLECSVVVLNAEQVAAELVTVGRNLVRVLREFDEVWPAPVADPASADAAAQGASSAESGSPPPGAPQRPEKRPEGLAGQQVGEERAPPYGLPAGEPAPKGREMTYPEYWQMIATALGELAGQLEQLSMEAVQRSMAWLRAERTPPPFWAGPKEAPPQAEPGPSNLPQEERPFSDGDPTGAGG